MELVPDQLPHEPPTPPTRTSEALKANLQSVNKHLDGLRNQWEEEKKKLLGEKAVLEDAANRLNGQVRHSKEEARKIAESKRVSEKFRTNVQSVCSHSVAIYILTNDYTGAGQSQIHHFCSGERTRLRAFSFKIYDH